MMSDDSSVTSIGPLDETAPLESSGSDPSQIDPTNPRRDPTVNEKFSRRGQLNFSDAIGSFQINREIGRGGMGVVYEATEAILNRRVALKVLPPAALMDDLQIRRFRNEAAAAAQLVHPNIVPVYSVGSDRGVYFYAMQLIEGQNIAQVIGSIRERLSSNGNQKQSAETPRGVGTTQRATETPQVASKPSADSSSIKQHMEEDFAAIVSSRRHPHRCQRLFKSIAALGRDAANAIGHAHDVGIVHRDIKPSNLLLDDKGKIWITDFGLAQIRDNPVGTGSGDIIGTLRYMSPEQASGRKFLIDHRTDIYSLGITLYELLTLKPAFANAGAKEIIRQVTFEDPLPLRQVNPNIPVELETIITRAIAKNPVDRYSSAHALAEDLDRFCHDQPIAARPPTALQRIRRWTSKHQTLSGVLAVGIGLVFLSSLGLTAVTWRSNQLISDERNKTVTQLSRSEGWRLATLARSVLKTNPGLAVALAVESSKRVGGIEVNTALQDAIATNHELQLILPRDEVTHGIALATRSQRVIFTVGPDKFTKGDLPAIIYDLKASKQVATLSTGSAVTSAVYSPNEDFVLTASASRQSFQSGHSDEPVQPAVLWEPLTERKLLTLAKHRVLQVWADMFAPDSSAIVVPGPGSESTVYSTGDATAQIVLRGHSSDVLQSVFSPDGNLIATADSSGEIRLWNRRDGSFIRKFVSPDNNAAARLLFSPDSKYVLLATQKATRTYSVEADQEKNIATWQRETTLVMSPRHNRTAGATVREVHVRDITTGDPICSIQVPATVSDIAFSPTGDGVAIAHGSTVSVFDAATGLLRYELLGHTKTVSQVVFNRSQNSLLTASADGSVRVWSEESGAARQRFETEADLRGPAGVQFDQSSRYVLSASNIEAHTAVFDADGKQLNGLVVGEVMSEQLSGGMLATVRNSRITLIDTATSRTKLTRDFADQTIRKVLQFKDGQTLAVIVNSGVSILWNTTKDEVFPLTLRGDQVLAWDFSSNGEHFLYGTANGDCFVVDKATGRKLRDVPHTSRVVAVKFLDDKRFLTIDGRSIMRVWNESDIEPEKIFGGGVSPITECHLTQDAKSLITYAESQPNAITCWNVDTGEVVQSTAGSPMQKVVLDPDRPVAVLASEAGLKLWDYQTGKVVPVHEEIVAAASVMGDQLVTIEYPKSMSLDGEQLLWTPRAASAMLRFYDLATGEKRKEVASTIGSFAGDLCVDPVKKQLAVTVELHSASIWDRQSPRSQAAIGAHLAPISFASFIGNTQKAVTMSWDGSAKIFDENHQLSNALATEGSPIVTGAVSDDGTTVAGGRADGAVIVWSTESGKELVRFNPSDSGIVSLEFGKGARSIVINTADGKVQLLDLISRHATEVTCSFPVRLMTLSSDKRFALLCSGTDHETGAASIVDLQKNTNELISGARRGTFASKSNRLAILERSGGIAIYKLNPDVAFTLESKIVPSESVRYLAFSPDDELLATSDLRGLSLWQVSTGEEVHRLATDEQMGAEFGNYSTFNHWAPFSPDGKHIVLRSHTRTHVLPTNPRLTLLPGTYRQLLPMEKETFHVGLADSVDGDTPNEL